MTGDDRDLYEAFAAVRREEEAGAPPMSIRPRTAREGGRSRFAAVAVCLSMTIAVAVWLLPGKTGSHQRPDRGRETASITTWKPATDFLLETPGREMLTEVPSVGEWHREAIARGIGAPHRRSRKEVLQ
jgi:hypothetical protein